MIKLLFIIGLIFLFLSCNNDQQQTSHTTMLETVFVKDSTTIDRENYEYLLRVQAVTIDSLANEIWKVNNSLWSLRMRFEELRKTNIFQLRKDYDELYRRYEFYKGEYNGRDIHY